MRRYGPKVMTKAANLAAFRAWLGDCRNEALDVDPASIARGHGMDVDDVRQAIMGERVKRARRPAW